MSSEPRPPAAVADAIRLTILDLERGCDPDFFSVRRAADAIEHEAPQLYGFDGPLEVLQTVRDFVADTEQSGLPEPLVDRLRDAYGDACALFNEAVPGDGEDNRHWPSLP